MAGGYLGKISAVIAANTGDYVRGLNEGAQATRNFAKSVQSTLTRSANDAAKAFEGIYTPLQQVERALRQAGQLRLNFAGFDGAIKNISDLQRRLNDVLTAKEIDLIVKTSGLQDIDAVKAAINSLSSKEIKLTANAGGLAGLQKERAALAQSGETTTRILNTKVNQDELDSLIAKLNVLDDRKIDLIIDIVNQRGLEEAITRTRQLQDVATQIAGPLGQAASEFGKLSQAAQGQFVPALGAVQGAVERFKADIEQIGPAGRKAFESLKADVDVIRAAISRLSEARSLTGGLLTGQELGFVAPGVPDVLKRLQAAQQQLAQAPAGVRASPIGREVVADAQVLGEQLNRVLARIERIRAEGGDITFSQRGLDVILERLQQVADETAKLAARGGGLDFVSSQGDAVGTFGPPRPFTTLPRGYFSGRFSATDGNAFGDFGPTLPPEMELMRQQAARRARAASAFLPPVLQRESDAMSDPAGFRRRQFGAEIGSASRQFDVLKSTISSVKSQIDQLPAGIQAQFIPAIQRAEREFTRLAASPNATSDSLVRLQQRLNAVQLSARRASTASEFTQNFGGAGRRGLDLGIDQRALRGIGGEIEFLQGRLSKLGAEARGPVVAALERFRQVAARGFDQGTIGTQQFTRQLGAARQEVIRLAAEALNVRPGRLADQLKRVGDVARGSFGNFNLAVQQAAFIVDDFFSVTGGLDQRIRAIANNVSQLGFIVGGTLGLGLGVAVSVIAQLTVGILKWTGATKSAEDRQRELEKSLETTNQALERQRDLAQQLRDSFRDLARSQRLSGLPDQFRQAIERNDQIDEFNRQREQRRIAQIESRDPRTIAANAEIASIDEQLRTEQRAAERQRLLARRARAEEDRRLAIQTVERSGRTNARALLRTGGIDEAINRQVQARQEQTRRLREAEQNGAAQRTINQFGRNIAVIDNTIERLRGIARNDALVGGQRLSENAQRINQNLQDVNGLSVISVRLAGVLQAQEQLQNSLNEAAISADEFTQQFGQLEVDITPLEDASIAAGRFAKALDDAASQLADAVAQELGQRSIQARREANADEARFGQNDPRTELARNNQLRLDEANRQAQDAQVAINEERSRLRLRFERDLLEGRGDPQAIALSARIRQIDRALSVAPRDQEDAARQEQLRVEREQRQLELDRLFSQRADVRALQRRADEGDIAAQQQLQRLDSESRGRDLLLTPAQRAARELSQQIDDIRAATEENVNQANRQGRPQDIPDILRQGAEAERRVREEKARQEAPAIFSLADAVQNAILQGPSRAALQATDASTVEGSRELTRLLRGDDAARNQDLVTLQREANDLLRQIAQGGAPVAN